MSPNDVVADAFVDDEEVCESMIEVLDALLTAMPVLETAHRAPTGVTLQGSLEIVTDSQSHLSVRTDLSTGLSLAEGWSLAGENGPTAEDAVDAMSEFTNLVAGSMKLLLPDESAIGIPRVETFEPGQAPSGELLLQVDHAIGRFHVGFHV